MTWALWRKSVDEPFQVVRAWAYLVPSSVSWQPWTTSEELTYTQWLFARYTLTISEWQDLIRVWKAGTTITFRKYTVASPTASDRPWTSDRWWAFSSPHHQHREIPYTCHAYTLDAEARQPLDPDEEAFVASGQPYFSTLRDALRYYIDGISSTPRGDTLRYQSLGLFVLNARARISQVVAERDHCVVTVVDCHRPVELKLFTDQPFSPVVVTHDGDYTIPWSDIPESADWILSDGTVLLDRKLFYRSPAWGANYRVRVNWGEASTLQEWLVKGEGPTIEFKERFPEKGKARNDLAETISAFANTEGGLIFLGVDDHGVVVGVDLPEKWEEVLTNAMQAVLAPSVPFDTELITYGDAGRVIVLRVPPWDRPVCVNPASPTWYLRRGSTDMPAGPTDVQKMLAPEGYTSRMPWSKF
jgi:hypothetical protein